MKMAEDGGYLSVRLIQDSTM